MIDRSSTCPELPVNDIVRASQSMACTQRTRTRPPIPQQLFEPEFRRRDTKYIIGYGNGVNDGGHAWRLGPGARPKSVTAWALTSPCCHT